LFNNFNQNTYQTYTLKQKVERVFIFMIKALKKRLSNASPLLSTHKLNPSQCTDAYLSTSYSAQTNDFWPSDFCNGM
jgi:hypothetical protein